MTLRRILTVDTDLATLKQRSAPVKVVDDQLRALMDDMLETMYAAPGIGLAAIQVGEPVRVLVMDLSRGDGPREPRFFVNPEIVWASEELVAWEEGCLSVPEIYDEVERAAQVRVRYLDYDGKQVEELADDRFADCLQHEMDHLNGVLFIDHLSRLKRDRAVAKVKKDKRTARAEAL
jgi:peptide deformylase